MMCGNWQFLKLPIQVGKKHIGIARIRQPDHASVKKPANCAGRI